MKRTNRRHIVVAGGVVAAGAWLTLWIGIGCNAEQQKVEAGHDEPALASEDESAQAKGAGPGRGPNGGWLFEAGDLGLELKIFETGVPPEFRAYVYRDGKASDPAGVSLEVQLERLAGRVDKIAFSPHGDYLIGDREVYEPHSFDVELVVREAGSEHRFSFSTYENRLALSPEQVSAAGIVVEAAGPSTVREYRVLSGRVVANEDALAHMSPRFPGVVASVHKRLGETVAKGDLLAVIESNESLHPYEMRSKLAGRVLERNVAPGEFITTDRTIFSIGDLSTVWVDLDVYRRDFGRLARGQRVWIDAEDGVAPTQSTLSYLAPIGSVVTQTMLARAVIANADGRWRPGQFVSAKVLVAEVPAAVVVRQEAIQRLRDWDVVFIADNGVFEAQPIELGARDDQLVEVVSGLASGTPYAASGSFILKAEAGKSGASHDH